jgi:hypothetical protein
MSGLTRPMPWDKGAGIVTGSVSKHGVAYSTTAFTLVRPGLKKVIPLGS